MRTCPYCYSTSDFHFYIAPRRFNHCPQCDLIYHDTVNSYDEVLSTYRESYFDRHSANHIQGSRAELFGHILNLIEAHQDIGTIMDVGTGYGLFLLAARSRGWKVKGLDHWSGNSLADGQLSKFDTKAQNSFFPDSTH